jgi:hypothetical protein
MLRDAAANGEPCPSNEQIAVHIGYRSHNSVSKALANLCDASLIRRHGANQGRYIEIVSTGERTAVRKVEELPSSTLKRPVREIVAVVANTAGLAVEDIYGRCRTKLYTRPRFLACHFAHLEGWSSAAIGRVFGRDHSSILHALGQVEPLLRTDPLFARLFRRIGESLAGIPAQTVTVTPYSPDRERAAPTQARHPVEIDETSASEVKTRNADVRGSARLLAAMAQTYPERCAA